MVSRLLSVDRQQLPQIILYVPPNRPRGCQARPSHFPALSFSFRLSPLPALPFNYPPLLLPLLLPTSLPVPSPTFLPFHFPPNIFPAHAHPCTAVTPFPAHAHTCAAVPPVPAHPHTCAAVTPATRSMHRLAVAGAADARTHDHSASADTAVVAASMRWSHCTAAVFSNSERRPGSDASQ
eukprot:364457-Chlamydomonas_euryale.AAC.1